MEEMNRGLTTRSETKERRYEAHDTHDYDGHESKKR